MLSIIKHLNGGNSECISFKLKIQNVNKFVNLVFSLMTYSIILFVVNNLYFNNDTNKYINISLKDMFFVKYKYIWIDIVIILISEIIFQNILNNQYNTIIKTSLIVSFCIISILNNKNYINTKFKLYKNAILNNINKINHLY